MGFKLRVSIEGLCVVFPSSTKCETEVIFVSTPAVAKDAHTCQVAVSRGFVSGGSLPTSLDGHDIHLYDGQKQLTSGVNGSHTLTNLPHYSDIGEFYHDVRDEVRRSTAPIPKKNTYWVGRIQLFDGQWTERDITVEEWDLAVETTPVPLGHARRVARRLVHEIDISDTYAQFELRSDGKSDFWRIEPAGGYADIVVGNYSHMEPVVVPGSCGVSAHFRFSLDIFKHPPVDRYILVQTTACPAVLSPVEAQSIHYPCVGGCAC